MHREGEDPLVILEDLRRAVALMDVEIDHQGTIDPTLVQKQRCCDRHIVEDAKSRALFGEGVMAAACGVAGKPVLEGKSSRKHRAAIRRGRSCRHTVRDRQADPPLDPGVDGLCEDSINISRAVHPLQPLSRGRLRAKDLIGCDDAIIEQQTHDPAELVHGKAVTRRHGCSIGRMVDNGQHRPKSIRGPWQTAEGIVDAGPLLIDDKDTDMTPIDRWLHAGNHAGRTAWYVAHALAAARLSSPVLEQLPAGLPDRKAYLADLRALLRRDTENIDAGRYAMPEDLLPSPSKAFRQSTRFLADLGRINLRRMRGDGQEVFRRARAPGTMGRRPRYFLQNFHYQTDGWMSDDSAELYDFQVDVLFNGATDAMRRQALLPIGDFLRDRRQANLTLVDIATGTGRFLRSIKQNYPRLHVTGIDLSAPYLAKASAALAPWLKTALVLANAEKLPLPSDSQDLVTSVYLMHELPKGARNRAAEEMVRVLKPGGRFVLVDSLQTGDHPPFDGLLELFPTLYHEPYYKDYVRTDLITLYEGAGLSHVQTDRAFMSKVMVFEKST